MKTKSLLMKSFLLSVVLLTACGTKSRESKNDEVALNVVALDEAAPPSAEKSIASGLTTQFTDVSKESEASEQEPAGNGIKSNVGIKVPEKIKKTADISLTVDDYKIARLAIDRIVKAGNAYIGGENEQNTTYTISNTMVIRVANKDFDRVVNALTAIDARVNSKNIYTEDVTAQFVDITARLKSKKEVEQRYIALLQKAAKVSDILEVEEQLRVIREEIEAKEGELKYLNDQVDYSTINLSFHQDFEYTPASNPGFFGRMGNAFGNGWNGFLSFLVSMMYAWPLWIMLSIGAYFLYRFIKKQIKK